MTDIEFMDLALKEAEKAMNENEIPVGAVVIKDGMIISVGHNQREKFNDVTSHAEIEALKGAAKKLGTWKLDGCTLYVTLEPCLMCTGAILQSRISRVVFGAKDEQDGAIVSNYFVFDSPTKLERPLVSVGVLEDKCSLLLKTFFSNKRK
ncbi:MAG: nucleoside deaminase [Bacilli bacterium]|nr:nucleoside deaminase [Bacilli bacterium]